MDNQKVSRRLDQQKFPTKTFFKLFGLSCTNPLKSKTNAYTFIELIHVCHFSFIAEVTALQDDGKVFALKFYYEPDPPQCYMEREIIDLLKKKNCSNILFYEDFHINQYGYFFVFPFIEEVEPPSVLPTVWFFLRDVATAIVGCHSNNVVHGDIKPSNILTSNLGEVYLCDFETAIKPEYDDPFTGTIRYWSPEVCKGQFSAQNFPRDVWAFGVVVIETVYKTYPFAEIDPYSNDYDNGDTLLESQKQFLSSKIALCPLIKIPPKWKFLLSENNTLFYWPKLLEGPVTNDLLIQHLLVQQLLIKLLTLDPESRCTMVEALEYIKDVIMINEQDAHIK